MRQSHHAQMSIFDFYAQHEHARQLCELSDLLDEHPVILTLVRRDFDRRNVSKTGACGLSMETVFRCLLLKKILRISYRKLAFHLSDSPSYRAFARLRWDESPGKSALQHTVRQITPETLKQINQQLMFSWLEESTLSLESLRIDSTVVEGNIADPMDSQMLNDGVRVLSRMMSKSHITTGVKLRFVDQRKKSKSLSFQIFNAKRAEKDALYPKLLACVSITLKQLNRATTRIRLETTRPAQAELWIKKVEHYRALLLQVIDQTQRRVLTTRLYQHQKSCSPCLSHTQILS